MTADDDRLELRIGGSAYWGWTAGWIEGGIEDQARSFQVTLVGPFQADEGVLVADDDVEIWAGSDRLMTGVIDDVDVHGDATSTRVEITGRSRTRELIDCSAEPLPIYGRKLGDVIERQLRPYKLELIDQAGVAGDVVRVQRIKPGEKIFDVLDALGREHAVLMTDDAQGRLVMTRAGARTAHDPIVRGRSPFLEGGVRWSVEERYSQVECRGQIATDDEVLADVSARVTDVGIGRFRRLIVLPEKGLDTAGARKRAAWEATTRAAKAMSATYTLRGWRQSNGALWEENTRVRVTDPRARLFDVELLIVHVRREFGPEGRKTTLTLGPEAGYTPEPSGRIQVDVGGLGAELELESTDPDDVFGEGDG